MARDGLRRYIQGKGDVYLASSVKVSARNESVFFPDMVRTTKELALYGTTTKFGNMICPFHENHDKIGKITDVSGGTKNFRMTGTPYARNVGSSARKGVEAEEGYMHCGCSIEDVLWDLYMWKGGKITSPTVPGKEGWRRERLNPRARAFMAQMFRDWTTLTVDDLYAYGPDRKRRSVIDIIDKQIAGLQKKKAELEAEKVATMKDADFEKDWSYGGNEVKKAESSKTRKGKKLKPKKKMAGEEKVEEEDAKNEGVEGDVEGAGKKKGKEKVDEGTGDEGAGDQKGKGKARSKPKGDGKGKGKSGGLGKRKGRVAWMDPESEGEKSEKTVESEDEDDEILMNGAGKSEKPVESEDDEDKILNGVDI